jgi:hypothetical protein
LTPRARARRQTAREQCEATGGYGDGSSDSMTILKKTPTSPRSADDWKAGKLPGPPMRFKYEYNKSNKPEDKTLSGIARMWAGVMTEDKKGRVPESLNWQELARYNYGTDDPGEVAWYKEKFNGCTKESGEDYLFDPGDSSPFLYIPIIAAGAGGTVAVPASASVAVNLPPPKSDFTKCAERRFADIDSAHKYLSKDKIVAAMNSANYTGADAAMLCAMYKNYSGLEDLSDDELGPETNGVYRADLVAFDRQWNKDASHKVVAATIGTFDGAQQKITGAGATLYTTPKVDPTNVSQGYVGDCWLLAAIVGMKDRVDSAVRAIITSSGGSFTVQFRDGSAAITVARPTDAQIGMLGSTNGNGLWLTVLELAHGKSRNAADPFDGADHAEPPGTGIKPMTGNSHTSDTLVVTLDSTTRQKLAKAFAAKKVVATLVRGNLDFWNKNETTSRNHWPMGHVYTILAFDASTDKITVRNPWGTGDAGGPKGKEVDWAEYTANFSTIAYED